MGSGESTLSGLPELSFMTIKNLILFKLPLDQFEIYTYNISIR